MTKYHIVLTVDTLLLKIYLNKGFTYPTQACVQVLHI